MSIKGGDNMSELENIENFIKGIRTRFQNEENIQDSRRNLLPKS